MSVQFFLSKYALDACWYGRQQKATPDLALFSSVMARYSDWIHKAKSIAETQISSQSLYVKECAADRNGNYLLMLWLVTSLDNTSVALRLDSPPGAKAAIQEHTYTEGYMPGIPLYLYVKTPTGIVYTVKPDKMVLGGRSMFEDAIRDFMRFHFRPLQQTFNLQTQEGTIVFTEKDAAEKRPAPIFRLRQCVNTQVSDFIMTRADDVQKLVHAVPISPTIKTPWKQFLDKLWKCAGLEIAGELTRSVKDIRYEVNVNLTAEELAQLIDCQQHIPELGRIGFKVKSSEGGKILWADKLAERQTVELNVNKTKGVFSAEQLLKALNGIYCKEGNGK